MKPSLAPETACPVKVAGVVPPMLIEPSLFRAMLEAISSPVEPSVLIQAFWPFALSR